MNYQEQQDYVKEQLAAFQNETQAINEQIRILAASKASLAEDYWKSHSPLVNDPVAKLSLMAGLPLPDGLYKYSVFRCEASAAGELFEYDEAPLYPQRHVSYDIGEVRDALSEIYDPEGTLNIKQFGRQITNEDIAEWATKLVEVRYRTSTYDW
jgi:hypothetical protein